MKKDVVREPRKDGWENLATLLGTSSDKRSMSTLNWELRPPEFYEQMYAGGGIPARIVDLIPDESLRHWIEFTGVDKDKSEQMHDICETLDLRGSILKSWKWGRAYGGGCLHVVTDTPDPSSPLQRGERVIGLRDLSRYDLRIMTTDIEFDFASPNWGHPRLYYLNVQMGSQYKGYAIHWTRMIRFDGQLVPRKTYIRNNYWHDSILNRLFNSIRNYETANDSAASCLMDFNVDVYSMKNLAQMIAAGKENIIKNRLEMMNFSKSVINAIIIDPDQESYENKGRSLQGVAELLVHQANRLVAETDIPHTKLLGESPDGSNSTGNSTSQQWYNFITSEQENYLRPKLRRLFSIVFPDMQNLGFKFKSLRVLDDTEKADLRLKTAQTDQIYLEHQVLDPSEVLNSRFGGDEYSIETGIDREGRDSGAIDPAANDMPNQEDPESGDLEDQTEKKAPFSKKDSEVDETGTQFGLRNEMISESNMIPKAQNLVGQVESLPMRDPKSDPKMKGPGIPNKPRTFLPERGNGVIAESGFDFLKDAGRSGGSQENQKLDEEPQRRRAATVIVRRGENFLMGKTNDEEKWTLPGGVIEDNESVHQGGLRELQEETGLKASRLKFLGTRIVENEMGKPTEVTMYEYNHKDDQKVTHKKDPDKEVSGWKWFSATDELPEEVSGNLKHANNIALDHMKLLK